MTSASTSAACRKQYVDIGTGEKLAYLDKGDGDVILLLHGNMSSSLHLLPLFNRLPGGFRVIAPDLRGFGDSTYNNRFDSIGELARDVKALADALGVVSAHVVGWSAGGGVALALAAEYPGLVRGVFSVEGASHRGYPLYKKNADNTSSAEPYGSKDALALDPVAVAPCLAATATQNAAFYDYICDLTLFPHNKPLPAERYTGEILKQRSLVDIDWALANFNMSSAPNAYRAGDGTVGRIKCPCVFTSGDTDYVVPPQMVAENVAAIAGARLIEYQRCGHSPFVDCPDRLTADLLNFVGRKK
ncbi:MAG: alpha/beta hydrolase [Clostridiales bacterium]|jgi:pimeloyl-ACP methyl ester carboxylesterase|nr:alpha/beta hydrolase [Clostridiales bacterium]